MTGSLLAESRVVFSRAGRQDQCTPTTAVTLISSQTSSSDHDGGGRSSRSRPSETKVSVKGGEFGSPWATGPVAPYSTWTQGEDSSRPADPQINYGRKRYITFAKPQGAPLGISVVRLGLSPGIYVTEVREGTLAHRAGIQIMDKIELLSEDASLPPERLIPRLNALSYLTLSVVECPEIRVQLDGSLAPVSLDLAWPNRNIVCMLRLPQPGLSPAAIEEFMRRWSLVAVDNKVVMGNAGRSRAGPDPLRASRADSLDSNASFCSERESIAPSALSVGGLATSLRQFVSQALSRAPSKLAAALHHRGVEPPVRTYTYVSKAHRATLEAAYSARCYGGRRASYSARKSAKLYNVPMRASLS